MAANSSGWRVPPYAILIKRQSGHCWLDIAWNVAERSLSAVLLSAIAPPCVALGALVRLVSGRTPLVAHLRVGRHGRTLWMLKFRTMWDETPRKKSGIFIEQVSSSGVPDKSAAVQQVSHPLARWMRRYSIDELPQLWHVITGEMALVGPRPITAQELTQFYGEAAREVTSVRPGITGLWQTRGRSRLTYRQRRRYDLFLVRKYSLGLAGRILLRTLPSVFRGENAW